jgi:hypothetical protein
VSDDQRPKLAWGLDARPSLITESDESLATHAPDLTMSYQEAQRIARLALLITAEALRAKGDLRVTPRFESLSQESRHASTVGAMRVVQALILLGYIEQ